MNTKLTIFLICYFANSIFCLDKQNDCKCRVLPQTKLIGGKEVHHLAYPWMVSLSSTYNGQQNNISDENKINFHNCGGIIVNERLVLTAAHCVPENETLYIGYGNDNDLVKIFNFGRIISINVTKHPEFKIDYPAKHILSDIALIELKNPIEFSENVKPACFLMKIEKLYTGYLEQSGWGAKDYFNFYQLKMKMAHLNKTRYLKEILLVDQGDKISYCRVNKKVICAKGLVVNDSSCDGDSGSPIHYTKNGKSYVIGLASFGNLFYEDNYHSSCVGETVYTRTSSFIPWIKDIVDEDICVY